MGCGGGDIHDTSVHAVVLDGITTRIQSCAASGRELSLTNPFHIRENDPKSSSKQARPSKFPTAILFIGESYLSFGGAIELSRQIKALRS
jgi:hypothetical protein